MVTKRALTKEEKKQRYVFHAKARYQHDRLVKALSQYDMHAMTREKSNELHQLLEQTRIAVEEKWMEWDN